MALFSRCRIRLASSKLSVTSLPSTLPGGKRNVTVIGSVEYSTLTFMMLLILITIIENWVPIKATIAAHDKPTSHRIIMNSNTTTTLHFVPYRLQFTCANCINATRYSHCLYSWHGNNLAGVCWNADLHSTSNLGQRFHAYSGIFRDPTGTKLPLGSWTEMVSSALA